jgi:thiaminase/transcriptional activator TenA
VTRILPLVLCAAGVHAQDFTSEMWRRIQPVYEKTIAHPFLEGLASGELPRRKFDFYLAQDSLYLGAFSRALSLLAARAPREEWALMLNRHAVEALEVERALHQSLLGDGRAPGRMAPTNHAYTSHLIATVSQHPFAEGLAAVLPCYWIYWEVGRHLKGSGSRNADYQRWIDQYADPNYGRVVQQALDVMNTVARDLGGAAREACLAHFEISARYEYMFWEMAWREEQWAP